MTWFTTFSDVNYFFGWLLFCWALGWAQGMTFLMFKRIYDFFF